MCGAACLASLPSSYARLRVRSYAGTRVAENVQGLESPLGSLPAHDRWRDRTNPYADDHLVRSCHDVV